jgi:poly(3-hydroxybutyrate) depolymerase
LRALTRLIGYSGLVLALAAGLGCSSKKRKPLEPLAAPSWRVELAVPGFGPAIVALPLGSRAPRPIAVVLHGAADRPEWQCGSFRGVLGGRLFIVCPQGKPRSELGDRFGLGTVDETAAELRAALAALKARFGGHVAPSPILLIGYAEGADQAAELARQEPSFFARVGLIDGNPTAISSSAATIFARGGGKRLLFFCSDAECQGNGVMRAMLLKRAGAQAKSVRRDVGPFFDGPFATALKGEMGWLLEGDIRYSQR